MNKKILFTTSLALVGLIGFSTIGKEAILTSAYTNYTENLLFLDKIELFYYEDGERVPGSVLSYKNNDKGYMIEEIYSEYDEDTKTFINEYLYKYEYNDQNLNTRLITAHYDEEDQVWVDSVEDIMKYNSAGQITSWINYQIDGEDKELWFTRTSEYNDKGLLTKYIDDHSQGYEETRYTYDNNNNLIVEEEYRENSEGTLILVYSTSSEYDANNDITSAIDYSYDQTTLVPTSKYVKEYSYSKPHVLSQMVFTEYSLSQTSGSYVFHNSFREDYTYNGDEITYTQYFKSSIDSEYECYGKRTELDTKDQYYSINYTYEDGAFMVSWGEKEVFAFNGNTYIGSKSYEAEEGESVVWEICDEEVVTYAKGAPVAGGGFPIGALIGIIVGVIVVVYVVGYILWKKAVLAFLAKPAFGKAYGWFDKGIVKIGGLFKKK